MDTIFDTKNILKYTSSAISVLSSILKTNNNVITKTIGNIAENIIVPLLNEISNQCKTREDKELEARILLNSHLANNINNNCNIWQY